MFKVLCSLALMLSTLVSVTHAARLEDEIQERYKHVENIKTTFDQVLTHRESGSVEKRTGTLIFERPFHVRWESDSPNAELLVISENEIWNYLPDEEVAYRYGAEVAYDSQILVQVITGLAKLDKDFEVKAIGMEEGSIALQLFPHEPRPDLVEALLWVDNASKLIKKVRILDFYGNSNELTFTKLDINVELEDGLFTFTPPEGVEVEDALKQEMLDREL